MIDPIVSILIVLDDALVQAKAKVDTPEPERLNPYCAGRCSSTAFKLMNFKLL